jgi:hypothetical protein
VFKTKFGAAASTTTAQDEARQDGDIFKPRQRATARAAATFWLDNSLSARQAPRDEIYETSNACSGGEHKEALNQMR